MPDREPTGDGAVARVDVLWLSAEIGSAERCRIAWSPDRATIEGTVVLPCDGVPTRIDYRVDATGAWLAKRVVADLAIGDDRRTLELTNDDGWVVDGQGRPDLGACIDVDLGWTPATNALPLRRSALATGDTVETVAAWVRFPQLDVVPARQRYERLAPGRVRYRSATFEAELTVTADDVVETYGDDLWRAVAIRRW